MTELLNELNLQLSDSEDNISFGDKLKSLSETGDRLAHTTPLRGLSDWSQAISPVRKGKKSFWESQDEKSPLKASNRDTSYYSDIDADKCIWLKSQENEILKSELDSSVSVIQQLKRSLTDLRKESNFKDSAVEKLRKYLKAFELRTEKLEKLAAKYKKKLISVKRMSQNCMSMNTAMGDISSDRPSAESLVQAIEKRVEDLKCEYEQAYTNKVIELNSQMNSKIFSLKQTYDDSLSKLREVHQEQIKRLEVEIKKTEEPPIRQMKLSVQKCSEAKIDPEKKEKTRNESLDLRELWKSESVIEEMKHNHMKACRKIKALQDSSLLLQQQHGSLVEENLRLNDEISNLKIDYESEVKARINLQILIDKMRIELVEAELQVKNSEKQWQEKLVDQKKTHFSSLASHESQLEQALHNYEEVCKQLAVIKSKKFSKDCLERPQMKDAMLQTEEDSGKETWDLLSLCLEFETKLDSLKADAKALLEYCENSHFGRKASVSESIDTSEAPSLYMQVRTLKSTVETKLSELLARIDAFQEDKKIDRTRLLSVDREFSCLDYTQERIDPLMLSGRFETPDLKRTEKQSWTHKRLSTIRTIEQLNLDFDCVDDTNLFNKASPSFCDVLTGAKPSFDTYEAEY
mmetsp:Transcript_13085/g.24457  ORF Transcript_13085/g.24457 Transcript_13085/m.24457 type:complete len:633 (+) Transcript_13085:3-1901(+)